MYFPFILAKNMKDFSLERIFSKFEDQTEKKLELNVILGRHLSINQRNPSLNIFCFWILENR